MQSTERRLFDSAELGILALALAVGVAAAFLAIGAHEGSAALILELMAGMILGFCRPRAAWRWAIALGAWIPVSAALQLPLPRANANEIWCADLIHQTAAPSLVAAILFAMCFLAVYAGVIIDWLLSFLLALLAALRLRWLHIVKPILRAASILLGLLIVLYAAVSLAQPLQPYGLRERYCWDEFCFSVQSVSRTKSLAFDEQRAVAKGTFYVVNARMEAPWWGRFIWGPNAVYVTDYAGTDYHYAPEAQRIVDRSAHKSSGCHELLGAAENETIVFDLPDDVVQPRLLVRDTLGLSGLLGGWRASWFYIKPAFNLRYD